MTSMTEHLKLNSKLYSVKKWNKPIIYHGGESFDLEKRWYVYYRFEDPETGKKEQQDPVYLNINSAYKTVPTRLKAIKKLRNEIERQLKKGFSPYKASPKKASKYQAGSCLDEALSYKCKTVRPATKKDYSIRIEAFKKFLEKKGRLQSDIKTIDKRVVDQFLEKVLTDSSARNRNNAKAALSSIFTTLVEKDYIDNNFIIGIKNIKTTASKHESYTQEEISKIHSYLELNDPLILLYVKFVSYNMLRPVEVCRLKMKDIDFDRKVLHVSVKNESFVKTKIIPSILFKEIEHLKGSNPEHYLFTPEGVGEWDSKEMTRRQYMTKRYIKHIKKLGFGNTYDIYSFRHTFITKVYKQLSKEFTTTEVLDKLMLITGHNSVSALKLYLRKIGSVLPEDYSRYL